MGSLGSWPTTPRDHRREGPLRKAGVLKYKQMGYWEPDYEVKETDVIALFRFVPQEGVDPEEAASAVAGESSTATWTVVWTDRLTATEAYRAKALPRKRCRTPGQGQTEQQISRISPTISTSSRKGRSRTSPPRSSGMSSVQAAQVAAARRHANSGRLKTFQGPPGDHRRASASTNSAVPLLGATMKPKLGLSGKNYGRVVYEGPRRAGSTSEGRREHQLAAIHALARSLSLLHGSGEPGGRDVGE